MVRFETQGSVGLITLDRPEARNAIDPATAYAIEECIDRVEADDEIWVGILSGGPPVFCAGADLNTLRDKDGRSSFTKRGGFAGLTASRRVKPLIAAVDGPALGGGLEMALACDLIVASRRSEFGLPEVKRSLIASAGGAFRLPRKIPSNIAMECILTGLSLDATRAHQIGLVNRLCDDEQVLAAAFELAASICAAAPLAVRLSRRTAIETAFSSDEEAWQASRNALRTVVQSADYAEGLDAFASKRLPRWTAQ